jgi:DNA-binding response OmpR family regulator
MVEENNKTVLVVEDDTILSRAIYLQLKSAGFTITTAEDGVTGLEVMQKVKPDLVILDLLLPKIDGFEVLRIMRSNSELKDIPVLVFSNLSSDEDKEKAKSLGAQSYRVKADVKMEDLTKQVKKMLNL